MGLVKVFNTKKFIETECKGWTTFNEHSHAVVFGNEKCIIVCSEGVHTIVDRDEKVEIEATLMELYSEDGFPIFPDGSVSFTVNELLNGAEIIEEKELGSFVRRFGSRLETNYRILLNSISDIGLNPADYPRNLD